MPCPAALPLNDAPSPSLLEAAAITAEGCPSITTLLSLDEGQPVVLHQNMSSRRCA